MRSLPDEIAVELAGKKGSLDLLAHLSVGSAAKGVLKHKMCKLVCLLGSEVWESKKIVFLGLICDLQAIGLQYSSATQAIKTTAIRCIFNKEIFKIREKACFFVPFN